MKRWMVKTVVFCLIAIAAAGGCTKGKGLSVNEVRNNPDLLQGTVKVKGVVGAFANDGSGVFGLMDVTELQCTSANCNKFFMPVRSAGEAPKMGDEVVVTGTLADVPGGKVFSAAKVDVIRNHKL